MTECKHSSSTMCSIGREEGPLTGIGEPCTDITPTTIPTRFIPYKDKIPTRIPTRLEQTLSTSEPKCRLCNQGSTTAGSAKRTLLKDNCKDYHVALSKRRNSVYNKSGGSRPDMWFKLPLFPKHHRTNNSLPWIVKLSVIMFLFCIDGCFGKNSNNNGLRQGNVGLGPTNHPNNRDRPKQCQEITIPMCKGIGYNYTYMPNQFNHDTQDEAGLEVHQFYPLVEINCSPDLKFFLCSMYAPICMTNYHKPLPACRSVCHRAKSGCAPLMRQYGFAWPERMKCDNLPVFGDKKTLCMDFNTTTTDNTKPSAKPLPTTTKSNTIHSGTPQGNKDCGCRCRMTEIRNHSSDLYGEIMTGGQENCAMTCKSPYFTEDERTFAQFWIGLWSILCCISTTLTLVTFFVDMQRFKYPERPIIFLSGCYTMVSIGFIMRLTLGHETIACDTELQTIRYSTNGPALCTIVFLLIYFFGMASSIWWVILAFTWFLSAGLKWGQEAIESYAHYFHIAAWLVPTIKTVTILAMKFVDGDPVAGICYVGNQSIQNLRFFVLIPLCIYLFIGTTFLIAGFISLFRIRQAIKRQGRGKTEKLERLMIRIGVFTVLYTVPATIVIACNFYDQYFRQRWESSYNCPCQANAQKPDYSVFMLKYFMCLVVGITSGFWVWSSKTIESYRNFYRRVCGCGSKSAQYGHQQPRHLPPMKYPSPPPSTNPSYQSVKPMPLSHV